MRASVCRVRSNFNSPLRPLVSKLCPWLQVECPPNTPQLCNGHSCPVKMSFSFVCERSVGTRFLPVVRHTCLSFSKLQCRQSMSGHNICMSEHFHWPIDLLIHLCLQVFLPGIYQNWVRAGLPVFLAFCLCVHISCACKMISCFRLASSPLSQPW